jgi:glycosyltransferase involved in cell wall biosynthesis
MSVPPAVSVVIPCYNEVGSIRELTERVRAEFVRLDKSVELLFIDDGSTDGTRELLRELAAADPTCRVICFRRNCGKSAALAVGFARARGAAIITMDADLQDDPQEIPRFLAALESADLVSGWKATRHDPSNKTLPSRLFNATVRRLTGVALHDMNCGFKAYRRAVVQEMPVYGELHRYLPVLAAARGFRLAELIVTHHPRRSGVSKFGAERLLRGFFDLFTVLYVTRFRFRPLHWFGTFALGCLFAALILAAAFSPYLTTNFLNPPKWHFMGWLLVTALFTMAPILFAIGLVAEGQLATTLAQQPAPPIVECLNCEDAPVAEDAHAS